MGQELDNQTWYKQANSLAWIPHTAIVCGGHWHSIYIPLLHRKTVYVHNNSKYVNALEERWSIN